MSRVPLQQRLRLNQAFEPTRANFMVSAVNAAAVAAVDAWPAWPGGLLALVGPEGSGKSHLARVWAERADAVVFSPGGNLAPGKALLIENADLDLDDDELFHLINTADHGLGLLATSRRDPRTWPFRLPDLRSRLAAIPTAHLGAPDDVVLEAVFRKLFRERNIQPPREVVDYLLRRVERSVPAARDIVARIDDRAAAERREVSRALVREILEPDDRTLGLFD